MTPYLAALARRRPDQAKPPSASCDIVGRPDRPSSIVAPIRNHVKWNRRRRPAAAAPPSRLERVGLVAELDVAARIRARVKAARMANAANNPLIVSAAR